mgnify:CR=1 FL=1
MVLVSQFEAGQEVVLTATVTDIFGSTVPATVSFLVNSPPFGGVVTLSKVGHNAALCCVLNGVGISPLFQ